jgi:adenine C2-methylase RlmN of 23S rRNA A2503 and tRNA A37
MELLGKSKLELRDFCVSLGEPAYRGGQLYHALYAERKFSVREISNLPVGLRERLAAEATITLPTVRQTYASQDGSVRYLFGLSDSGADAKRKSGPASVEAVFMPSPGRQISASPRSSA